MPRTVLLLAVALSALASLCGCANLNADFDCPMRPGALCKSLDEVNGLVDQGQLGGAPDGPTAPGNLGPAQGAMMTVWLAPYQDSAGDRYAATTVYPAAKSEQINSGPLAGPARGVR